MAARLVALVVAVAILTIGLGQGARPASARASEGTLKVDVLAAPSPVLATDQRRHLVYEIVVDNHAGARTALRRLEVRGPAAKAPMATFDARALAGMLVAVDRGRPAAPATLMPGERGVLFLDVALPARARVPARLVHRFRLSSGPDGGRARAVTTAETRVDLRPPIVVGPPLRGAGLGDVVGCCGPSDHTRAVNEIGGQFLLAQRFAVDFVRLHGGSTYSGDPGRNRSYLLYGAPVLAVAPGRVVATRNDLPQGVPGRESKVTLETAAGNRVVEDLGAGRFALYAHLQPGSVRVRVGQRVRRGAVLGLVGNSGASTEPHLHFHVMDGPGGPSALAANGLPYVFDRVRLDARVPNLALPRIVPPTPPRLRVRELPLQGDILAFGGGGGGP
jgi:peptidase M23-like protein